jgi:hypothetical protein
VLRSSLIVVFYNPKVNKFNVVAIPSFAPLQYRFGNCVVGWSVNGGGYWYIGSKRYLPQWVVGRKGREQPTLFIALPSWVITMVALLHRKVVGWVGR